MSSRIEVSRITVDRSISTRNVGARVANVRVGSHSFQTPTRPFSVAEITAKSYLGYRGHIRSDVATLPIDFSGKRKELFLKNNGALHRAEQSLQSSTDCSFGIPTCPILQLDPFDPSDLRPFKIAFDMQKDVDGLDMLCMPQVVGNTESFEKVAVNWCKSAEDYGKGVAVQLSLSDTVDTFSSRLDIIAEMSRSGMVQVVNVKYVDPSKCRQQLVELWHKCEDIKAILNCTGVKSVEGNTDVVGMKTDPEFVLLQQGFDMITRKKITVSGKYIAMKNNQPPAQSLDDIDDFKLAVHEASVALEDKVWSHMKHPLECRCSICRGDNRDKLVERFSYKDNGDIDRCGMRYYSRLHDHQSDMNELEILRKYTKSEGMAEYEKRIDDMRCVVKASL